MFHVKFGRGCLIIPVCVCVVYVLLLVLLKLMVVSLSCSSKSGEGLTSLEKYVSRMKDGQKNIYYITGQSKEQLEKSPFLEKLLKKGYEVRPFTKNRSLLNFLLVQNQIEFYQTVNPRYYVGEQEAGKKSWELS